MAWTELDNFNVVDTYCKWFDTCNRHNVKLIRIFLNPWSLNSLYDENYLLLNRILKEASNYGIDIILVVNNFIDFNTTNYIDIADVNYSWKNNIFSKKYKTAVAFFKTVDQDYLKMINKLLKNIEPVQTIELMNELDALHIKPSIAINWMNNLISNLDPNYKYQVSIANHSNYKNYAKHLKCSVDLHTYSFPTPFAIENISYFINKYQFKGYIGEYAKHSDSAYLDQPDSLIYFTAGIWGAFILGLENSPLHWWWSEVFKRNDYLLSYDLFNKYSFEQKDVILETDILNYQIKSHLNLSNEKSKIYFRLLNLLKHPSYLKHEVGAIKKFTTKKMIKQKALSYQFFNIEDKKYCLLESYAYFAVNYTDIQVISLIDGNKINDFSNINPGCYLLTFE